MYWNCVELDYCNKINYASGLLEPGDSPLIGTLGSRNTDFQYFRTAGILDGFTPNQLGLADSRIDGLKTFCYKATGGSAYGHLVHVVYSR